MAISKAQIASGYPLPVYNYRVTIDGTTMSFSEVSGLTLEYEKVIYKDGLTFRSGPEIIRSQSKEVNITLKRGVVAKRNDLFKWMQDKSRKSLSVDLCGPDGIPVVRWKVINALPLKMDAPSFNASGNDLAIESIELIALDLTIEHL